MQRCTLLTINEADLSVQEHTAWIVLYNMGYYGNTSVVLCSYSSIFYFIFQVLFVNIFKLAYRLKTFVKDFFTTILFNMVVTATICFSWYFTYEKTVTVSQANKGEMKIFHVHLLLFLHRWHHIIPVSFAWYIKGVWAEPFSSGFAHAKWHMQNFDQ